VCLKNCNEMVSLPPHGEQDARCSAVGYIRPSSLIECGEKFVNLQFLLVLFIKSMIAMLTDKTVYPYHKT
jgi:hypothetical protein